MARHADDLWEIRPHTDNRVTVHFTRQEHMDDAWRPMIDWIMSEDAGGFYDWDWIDYPYEAEFGFSSRYTAFEFKMRFGGRLSG